MTLPDVVAVPAVCLMVVCVGLAMVFASSPETTVGAFIQKLSVIPIVGGALVGAYWFQLYGASFEWPQ